MKKIDNYTETQAKTTCYHCGELCADDRVDLDNKAFCCTGCKLMYEVLKDNDLCNYYDLENQPGQTIHEHQLGSRFSYLDDDVIVEKIQSFRDANSIHIRLHIPSMHCTSCIWLLENLGRIVPGIFKSQVDFVRKEFLVVYDPTNVTLRKIVESLSLIGYEPELNLQKINTVSENKNTRTRIYRIGVAGFAFGNIMLLSFPEYFSSGTYIGFDFGKTFGYINLILALPVFFYSSWEFIGSAIRSFRQKAINIDVPLSLGIIALFLRSVYEVISGTGPGYFDSLTGLVFFMLIGRNFQDKTFSWLSFERDYNSYLPIAVTRLNGNKQESVPVNDLVVNDRIILRNQDIIPADIILLSERVAVDYSFITGESHPVQCIRGERIFAGAKVIGIPVEAMVQKEVSQSYITQLWNQSPAGKSFVSGFSKLTSAISIWFIVVTLIIALAGWLYWYPIDPARAINSFTAVLVIACACALALSGPFTFGNMLRILGANGIYLRNATVIEKLADIKSVVFDKTGTLTIPDVSSISWDGTELSDLEYAAIRAIASSNNHPLSRELVRGIKSTTLTATNISEYPGLGISGVVQSMNIKLGNSEFCNAGVVDTYGSLVYVAINDIVKGKFLIGNTYREGLVPMLQSLKNDKIDIRILSGDNSLEQNVLENLLGKLGNIHFNQSPIDKLNYIKQLQTRGTGVLMAGDGLNDAGALLQSDVGLAVAADVNNFSPACDGILTGNQLTRIDALLKFSRYGIRIIVVSFIISLFYNVFGLYYAVSGNLSPMFAAILMPISTTSLVLFTVISSSICARSLGLNNAN